MAIKDILVPVAGTEADEARLDEAITLAKANGADLTALHMKTSPAIAPIGPGGDIPVVLIEEQEREIEQRARTAEAKVLTKAEEAQFDIEWVCAEGDVASVVGTHTRYADLVIASPDLTRDLVFESGAPVLAFPKAARPNVPKRALIAWNGSRESARAVHDVMPLIENIEQVDVVVIDPPEDRAIGADLVRSLGRHGIAAEVRERKSEKRDIGELLLEEAKVSGADLLVMGAYDHSCLREWVFGGATETALEEAAIPVLLSH
ncbi:MAG: universal stress protein [Alphaproteobacteria bacterium]|nr:universal stress protein [Alphaproteobacteria bacterium]